MTTLARLLCLGAICLLPILGGRLAAAEPAAPAPATEAGRPSAEDRAQAELLRSVLQLREQLHAAQLAIVNNRVEVETNARIQSAALAEKLDGLKAAMAAERERHQKETQQLMAERERQQAETQRSMRTVLWVAAAFGAFGLIAVLLAPFLQMRAIGRATELAAGRAALPGGETTALLAPEGAPLSDHKVTQSNQRLLAVIDRMEKRIIELEQTAGPGTATTTTATASVPAAVTTVSSGGADAAPRNDGSGQAAWISVLMAKGRSLLSVNKAQEAITCYDEILKLEPAHTEALVRKGAALERLNRFEEALHCYDRAIAANQRYVLAYLHKGGVCNRLERYDEALECYELALQVEEKTR